MPMKTLAVQIWAWCVERIGAIQGRGHRDAPTLDLGTHLGTPWPRRGSSRTTGAPVGCPYHLGVDLAGRTVGASQLARSRQLLAVHVCLPRDLGEGVGAGQAEHLLVAVDQQPVWRAA